MIFSGLIKMDAMKIPMPDRKNLVSMTKKLPSKRTKTDNASGVANCASGVRMGLSESSAASSRLSAGPNAAAKFYSICRSSAARRALSGLPTVSELFL